MHYILSCCVDNDIQVILLVMLTVMEGAIGCGGETRKHATFVLRFAMQRCNLRRCCVCITFDLTFYLSEYNYLLD